IYGTAEEELRDLQAKGIRNVMAHHTTYERINQIASDIGLDVERPKNKVLTVLEEDSKANRENFDRQVYEHKTLISRDELDNENISDYDFIVFFSDRYVYEEYYIDALINAFKYTDVDFVTKDENFEAHNYINEMNNHFRSMIDARVFEQKPDIVELTKGYNLDDVEILDRSTLEDVKNRDVSEKELSVIVPIHNNGTYLEENCSASLK